MYEIDNIKNGIEKIHSSDAMQLDIIFSKEKRIIVEAPAGCGKTKTMISKIAYLLSTNSIQSTKKILALTFSVNAAYKIKKEIYEELPAVTGVSLGESINISNKIHVANYHSFSRRVISLYGEKIIDRSICNGINFENLFPINDDNEETLHIEYGMTLGNSRFLSNLNNALKKHNTDFIDNNWNEYNDIVKKELIPKGYITYNAIILLAYEIFTKFPKIKEFYNNYFPVVFVDEFQDTNYIAWILLKEIISDETRIVFMGDPLQRIYGFIGAIPNLMSLVQEEYNMKSYELSTNYRFRDNKEMLLLDRNIRANAIELNGCNIDENANPNIIVAPHQDSEAMWICNKIRDLSNQNEKIAVLVRAGINNSNTKYIANKMKEENIPFFFALFTDNDIEYEKFHEICLSEFNKSISINSVITTKTLKRFIENVKAHYEGNPNEIIISLMKLLGVFCERIGKEYNYLSNEELTVFIQDTFINKGLKQNMDKINEDVILATIHAFKGLEYPNIIIADNEKDSFPNYIGACKYCNQRNNPNCIKISLDNNEKEYYEELSVFYVGITRAIKNVYLTSSKTRLNYHGREIATNLSCFLNLRGITFDNLIELS